MFVLSGCKDFPLTENELENLWQAARITRNVPDDEVAMRCVDVEEIQRLNKEYRNKDIPTNILTFSYKSEGEHDIALCMEVARTEANARGIAIRDYVALLVTHAVLHVCGMDHETSEKSSLVMKETEREILRACGFVSRALSDVY